MGIPFDPVVLFLSSPWARLVCAACFNMEITLREFQLVKWHVTQQVRDRERRTQSRLAWVLDILSQITGN